MSVIDTIRVAPFAGFSNVFSTIASVVSDWNDARMTRNVLSQLSARQLDDIGLNFGDIERISRR